MTDKQVQQIKAQLPGGEKLNRMYSAIEGGIRAISRDRNGNEYRYRVIFGKDDSVTIERM